MAMILKESIGELLVDPKVYTSRLPLPDARLLRVYDTTLRDGEQTPGVALGPEQKYRIARELSAIGCHVLDLCFPTIADEEAELLRLTCQGKRRGEIRPELEISLMCRASKKDIDATIDTVRRAGFDLSEVYFLIFTSSSALHVKYKLGRTLLKREGLEAAELHEVPMSFFHQANQRLVREMIGYARDRGVCNIEFGGEDSSRTPVEQLIEMARVAVEAGARRYILGDTTGSLTPEATQHYCSAMSAALPEIERVTHFHDDFDLATANNLTAVLNGFTTFTTTVNGIGERAGNAPMHSIVAALRYLYGLEIPGFQYDRLIHLRRVVEELTGLPVSVKEPVIGSNVFTHESGIHTHGVSIARQMYESIPAEEVGSESRFLFGKHSGTASVEHLLSRRATEVDHEATPDFVQEVLREIKDERASILKRNETAEFIHAYYRNIERLGLGENEVVEIAQRVASRRRLMLASGG